MPLVTVIIINVTITQYCTRISKTVLHSHIFQVLINITKILKCEKSYFFNFNFVQIIVYLQEVVAW